MALLSQKNPPSKTANARQPIKSRSAAPNKRKRGHRRSAFRIYHSAASSTKLNFHDDASTCSTSEASARQPEVQPISPEKSVSRKWAGASFKLPTAPSPNAANSTQQSNNNAEKAEYSWDSVRFPSNNNQPSSSNATCRSSWSAAKPTQQTTNSLAAQMTQLAL